LIRAIGAGGAAVKRALSGSRATLAAIAHGANQDRAIFPRVTFDYSRIVVPLRVLATPGRSSSAATTMVPMRAIARKDITPPLKNNTPQGSATGAKPCSGAL
jgi:hypothetical protein